ncbi:MAG TPA: carbamoyltransferase C-terminal domain-containing protein, partial [Casimicrobiaceae bacterium]|nr:carbamoyltransferase C-terminal domain-containing protein [Casimicrobiaceae bacterium]
GCAMYGLVEVLGERARYRWRHDYLGPAWNDAAIADAARDVSGVFVDTPPALVDALADLLAGGNVVGLYHGRSEFGPRALGHRSILADPRTAAMRDFVNAEVKKREWFLPLAPVVLLEHADRYFEISRASPFMQFAAPVRPRMAATIPAVTHVDCTARLQTVGPDDDPFLRSIIERFAARTGLPVLLNTSFNGKDEPIVESPSEALATFLAAPMQALAMPPYLIRKRAM